MPSGAGNYAIDAHTACLPEARLSQGRFGSKSRATDWRSSYQKLTLRTLYQFLDCVLNQKTGAQGQLKRGIRKKSSLRTYQGLLRLAFGRGTLFSIDALIDRRRLSNVYIAAHPFSHYQPGTNQDSPRCL